MDRDETVRISRLVANNSITIGDISMVLMQYCIEQGKPYYETTLFVTKLLSSAQLAACFITALDYYERKFTIYKLWDKPNILQKSGGLGQLLQIF
jgi:hypothetical protein